MQVMNFNQLNIQTTFLAKSGRSLKLMGESKTPLELQSGRLYLPFGASSYPNKWSGMDDYSISCYVDSEFEEFSAKLDAKIEEDVKQFSPNSEFTPTLRQNKDYPNLL